METKFPNNNNSRMSSKQLEFGAPNHNQGGGLFSPREKNKNPL